MYRWRVSLGKRLVSLVLWCVIAFIPGVIGGVASIQARSFYMELARPEWAPPGWVFGPVWSTLYLMMGLSAWLVWLRVGLTQGRVALGVFFAQLVLNALWSWLFFAWRLGGAAFADIVLLWGLILGTVILFWRIRPLAGALLLPYLGWVSFAAALNWATWRMNPGLLG